MVMIHSQRGRACARAQPVKWLIWSNLAGSDLAGVCFIHLGLPAFAPPAPSWGGAPMVITNRQDLRQRTPMKRLAGATWLEHSTRRSHLCEAPVYIIEPQSLALFPILVNPLHSSLTPQTTPSSHSFPSNKLPSPIPPTPKPRANSEPEPKDEAHDLHHPCSLPHRHGLGPGLRPWL